MPSAVSAIASYQFQNSFDSKQAKTAKVQQGRQ